jgi:lipoprotein signal peptidase
VVGSDCGVVISPSIFTSSSVNYYSIHIPSSCNIIKKLYDIPIQSKPYNISILFLRFGFISNTGVAFGLTEEVNQKCSLKFLSLQFHCFHYFSDVSLSGVDLPVLVSEN